MNLPFTSRKLARMTSALALLASVCLSAPTFAADTIATTAGTRTLYLIRHGNYDEADKTDDAIGRHLTPLGIAQAKLLASRLRTLPVRFDEIIASPLTRARETAAVIGADLGTSPARIVPDLAECTPPTRRKDVMAEEKPEALAACRAQLEHLAATLFRPARGDARHELVVCHGNITRWLVTKALGVDVESWLGLSIGHASLTVIRIQPDGTPRVLAVGDVGHLPENLQTGRIDTPERKLATP